MFQFSAKQIMQRYRFDVKAHLLFGRRNNLTVAFRSPVQHAKYQYEQHKQTKYIVPPEEIYPYMNGHSHVNFIR